MERSEMARRIYRILFLFSMISAPVFSILATLLAFLGVYWSLYILIPLALHGFWGAPIYHHKMKKHGAKNDGSEAQNK